MNPLTLKLRQPLSEPVDLSDLRLPPDDPEPAAALARARVRVGGRPLEAGEVFEIQGEDPKQVEIFTDGARIHGIGTEMAGGTLIVHGDAGDHLAHGMRSGTIRVEGSCGNFAASDLKDGLLDIQGDAGAYLAGAIPGEMSGARGGTILVRGRAGERVCDRMRRGLVLVGNDTGDYPASRMRAGTLIVLGHVGKEPGFGMIRGTLVLSERPASLPAAFNRSGEHELLFLRLLTRHVEQQLGAATPPLMDLGRVERWMGDRSHDGRGEVLVPAR
ncbi:formylmethanofuran dehydrogenase subunit C [Thiohalorhabdus methylotrophus]|uniref:Formylmethanofuran dehydrogenase subunit C n=1 Tax=Thiohalorhabdus methylotrophus TaxID=3242694 RepID=A0ABV4TW45_9GAMM